MSNDEIKQLRREINESVLTEGLEQHHELYADDINVPIEEAWDQPAMGRDVGMGYGRDHDHMGMAHGRDMAYGRDSEFPDLNKDGETTMADVLVGRGVIDKPASARDDMGDAHGRDMAYGRDLQSMGTFQAPSDMGDVSGRQSRKMTRLSPAGVIDPEELVGAEERHQADIKTGTGDMASPFDSFPKVESNPQWLEDQTNSRDVAYGRDMGMAYKGDDTMTWDEMTGEVAHNREDEANLWESKSATVRGWIIENFKPLRSDGYDPERIVSVLNERAEDELTPVMLQWFHENKRQLQKDGYDFDLVVDKLNED